MNCVGLKAWFILAENHLDRRKNKNVIVYLWNILKAQIHVQNSCPIVTVIHWKEIAEHFLLNVRDNPFTLCSVPMQDGEKKIYYKHTETQSQSIAPFLFSIFLVKIYLSSLS